VLKLNNNQLRFLQNVSETAGFACRSNPLEAIFGRASDCRLFFEVLVKFHQVLGAPIRSVGACGTLLDLYLGCQLEQLVGKDRNHPEHQVHHYLL
jgi:hypothetical protein